MKATSVGIDREFVETWAKRYRCGAMNSPWHPGPKLNAVIKAHPELSVLAEITTYWELETHIFEIIELAVRKAGFFTLPQFITVGYWKTPRQLTNYRKNDDARVREQTRKALGGGLAILDRTTELSGLDGVRVPVASALLTVWNPNQFTIIDVLALKTLSCSDERIDGIGFHEHSQTWCRRYDMYLRACDAIVSRLKPLTLRDVDRALWKWGQLNA
jgi:hypothetical protein